VSKWLNYCREILLPPAQPLILVQCSMKWNTVKKFRRREDLKYRLVQNQYLVSFSPRSTKGVVNIVDEVLMMSPNHEALQARCCRQVIDCLYQQQSDADCFTRQKTDSCPLQLRSAAEEDIHFSLLLLEIISWNWHSHDVSPLTIRSVAAQRNRAKRRLSAIAGLQFPQTINHYCPVPGIISSWQA